MQNERVILRLKPAPVSIVLRSVGTYVRCAVLVAIGLVGGHFVRQYTIDSPWVQVLPVVSAAAIAVWKTIKEIWVWRSREYVLTDKRVVSGSGILHTVGAEAALEKVQQIVVDRTLGERLLGLGTIAMSTAGSQLVDVAWVNVARAGERAGAIREAIDRAKPAGTWLTDAVPEPIVIGIAGGIGSGKSHVARALGDLGYIVLDSDRDAKAALDRPDVRETLVRWWGDGILDENGRVDRKKIASIVFGDGTQRAKLEGLVHPIVKASRGVMIAKAQAESRPGVVIDAPLLFEAGSDAECDYIIFVDAPIEQRMQRVSATRGWDEAELQRRENAQLPLEEKRRRSDVVIANDSTPEAILTRAREVERQLRAKPSRRAAQHTK